MNVAKILVDRVINIDSHASHAIMIIVTNVLRKDLLMKTLWLLLISISQLLSNR